MSSYDARAVFAALANDTARTLYAARVLGADVDLAPSRRNRAEETLRAAGLLDGDQATAEPFRQLLAARRTPAREKVTGPERFLDADGRIVRWPRIGADRDALLRLLCERLVPEGARLGEKDLGERLATVTDDVPLLRRELVDAGLLGRAADGSVYWRR